MKLPGTVWRHRGPRLHALIGFLGIALAGFGLPATAWADARAVLDRFVQGTSSARATFTQTVVPPPRRADADAPPAPPAAPATGQFAFQRPDRFRFIYEQPYEQEIIADGQRVWLYDPDLRQASSRAVDDALGATPAALLAGSGLERDFELTVLPDRDGLQWVRAIPRQRDGAFEYVDVGFRGETLSALEIADSFGQRTVLRFERLEPNVTLDPALFRFVPPPGVDVIEQ